MKIRFETTIDDVVAFQRFHFANSPTWRRQVWFNCLLVPAILGGLLLLMWVRRGDFDGRLPDGDEQFLWATAGISLVISIVWIFLIRWHLYRTLGRNTRKFLAEGSNRTLFGWREMELVNNRLILKTDLIHSILDLRAIEKIVGNDDYTYVYISATGAYMIPMNRYPEDEYREFVIELHEAWDNREAPRLPKEADALPRQPDSRIC